MKFLIRHFTAALVLPAFVLGGLFCTCAAGDAHAAQVGKTACTHAAAQTPAAPVHHAVPAGSCCKNMIQAARSSAVVPALPSSSVLAFLNVSSPAWDTVSVAPHDRLSGFLPLRDTVPLYLRHSNLRI